IRPPPHRRPVPGDRGDVRPGEHVRRARRHRDRVPAAGPGVDREVRAGGARGSPPMTHGMLLGKFLPPHLGHVYLAEFASRYADRLTVVVCSLRREPIPGELRSRWMRELFPLADVVHLTDELPQEPAEHPDFWEL